MIVQPQGRGTAAGIYLPLLSIVARDPDAEIAVLPSDHHVDDEACRAAGVRRGARGRPPRRRARS